MEDIKQSILPLINTQNKNKNALSPFTWTNFKLPNLQNHKKQKNKEFNQQSKNKKTLQPKINNKSLQIPKIQKPEVIKIKKIPQLRPRAASLGQDASILAQEFNILPNYRSREKVVASKINKTIQIVRSFDKTKSDKQPAKRMKFLDDKNNMEKYLRISLNKIGWCTDTKCTDLQPRLLWANADRTNDYIDIKKGQFYNHLNGSFHLTNKDKLHQELAIRGHQFYPRSYLIPNQYDNFVKANNDIAIREMLKKIADQIMQFMAQKVSGELIQVSLGQILQSSIVKQCSEQKSILIKMSMYLQILRKQQGYIDYFQSFTQYMPVNIRPKPNLFNDLIQKAISYLENKSSQFLKLDYKNIDYRLLTLILHYYKLLGSSDTIFNQKQHLWIVKPIASSRGAGVSVIKSSGQFCSSSETTWKYYKNLKRYQNKIIQLYICNPSLLSQPKQFKDRKFDIRQWVLVASHNNRAVIYQYHTGYCRFSHEKYTLNKLNNEIHLTNYSIFKQTNDQNANESILMLEDLFNYRKQLQQTYNQQAKHIILETISKCQHIRYQDGCFELFGFDFLIDSDNKVYLLEVNLNPACSSERNNKLKVEAQNMTKTMISLVTEQITSDKWVKIYGNIDQSTKETIDFKQSQKRQSRMTPIYTYELDPSQSILAMIRIKNYMLSRMFLISEGYITKLIFQRIKNQKESIISKNQSVKQSIKQKTIQNNEQNGLIKFIEEKSTYNL